MRSRLAALRAWVAGLDSRTRRRALGGALMVALAVLVGLSVEAESTTTYDLHDSGVWISREGDVGRLNAQIAEVDYVSEDQEGRLEQDGRQAYLLVVGSSGSVTQLDAADPAIDPTTVAVPGASEIEVGGGVVAAVVRGELRILGRDGMLSGVGETVAEVGDDALLAVGPSGAVATLDPATGRLVTLGPGAVEVGRDRVDPLTDDAELTVVGDRAVILDLGRGRLVVPDGDEADLGELGDGLSLQLPGPDSGDALVASGSSLAAVDLDDGSIDVIDDSGAGEAVRPASDGSCSFGAWLPSSDGTQGRVAVHCEGEEPLTEVVGGGSWRFRTGGPSVVLNDTSKGATYVRVDDHLELVVDWPAEESNPSEDQEIQQKPPDPTRRTPPIAEPDVDDERLGARPGRTTFLQVLRNDWDPDGDIVYVNDISDGDPRITIAQGGRSVALDLSDWPDGEGGTIRFEYQISDGELTSDTVAAEVEIVTGEGSAPQRIGGQPLEASVEVGRRLDYEVLSAFWDPDGDPIFLGGATPPPGGHQVDWESDGWVTFGASNVPGGAPVGLTVSDITGQSVSDVLQITVETAAPTSLPPVARNDFVTATVGSTVTLEPLANDADPNDDELSLVDVELLRGSADGLGRIDVSTTTASVEPQAEGDYVLLYTVSDGTAQAQTATATILLRVIHRPEVTDPVAIADVVLVEAGRSAEVDLTRNDVDPLGRLLSVTAIGTPVAAPGVDQLTFGLANDFRTFRVDTLPGADPDDEPVTVAYEVSNGSSSARSTVTIVVMPAPGNRPPQPVVPAPVVVVRAGEVATVPLASFAWDPDGDPLTVEVSGPVDAGDARPSGTSIRYFAPLSAGGRRVTVPVQVREPSGTTQAASIVMDVIRPERNSRPEALDIEARVRSGGEVVIPVPLLGLDPDGDPVRLLGRVGSTVIRGEVVEDHGRQAFVYRATDRSFTGQDTFSYRVVDSLGAESTDATVTVAVTSAGENSPPVAATDRAITRVGGEIWLDPLANDTDIDGDPLELAEAGVTSLTPSCEVAASGGKVQVRVGDDPDECTITYQVIDVDARGRQINPPVDGRIVVQVLPEFDGTRPIARDDYASLEGDVDAVRVAVLANDEDPDGLAGDLRVELVDPPTGASFDRRTDEVVIPVLPEPQIVRYRITDVDDLTADAVVWVPGGAENRPPQLVEPRPDIPSVRADGLPVEIDLTDHIVDPDGDGLTFSDISSASAVDTTLRSRLSEGVAVFDPISEDLVGLVTFQVTATDDAPEPLSRVFTITVRVEQRLNRPPEWKGSPCRPVEKGAAPTSVSLSAYVEDPDLDPLTFSGGGSEDGVTARVTSEGDLVLSASAAAVTGDVARFTLVVEDTSEGGRVEATCEVEVLATSRPPILATNTTVETRQGEPVRVDVAPLVVGAEGEMTLVSARMESGTGTVTTSGTTVTYTSPADLAGEVTIRYAVTDELDDVNEQRRASATITVRVVGRPAPPEAVVAVSDSSATVTVAWRNGAINGSPVTSYIVRAVDGSASRTCSSSPCTLTAADGIVNGHTYRFTVAAVNSVGESDPSAPSNEVTPNATPGTPIELTARVIPGDSTRTGRVEFTWSAGPNEGTDVLEYVLAGAVVGGTGGTGTSTIVSGANGQEMCLSVAARNAAGEGPRTAPVCATPYGRPIVTITSVQATGRGEGTLVWAVDSNGRPLTGQSVTGCTTDPASIGTATRTVTLRCGSNLNPTITVEATNAGDLRGTATTQPQLYAPPEILSGFSLTPGKETVEVDRRPMAVSPNREISEWQARLPGGAWATLPNDNVVGAPAWVRTSLELRACNSPTSCSDPVSADAAVVPYGTPDSATELVAVRQAGQTDNVDLTFAWSAPADPGPWSFTYEVRWGVGSTSGSTDGPLFDQRTVTFTGVAPEAQSGELTICVRNTGACATTSFEIPAAPP